MEIKNQIEKREPNDRLPGKENKFVFKSGERPTKACAGRAQARAQAR